MSINRKLLLLFAFIFLFTLALTIFLANKQKNPPPIASDCKILCQNNRPITCQNSNDCRLQTMTERCNQTKLINISGFSGYCQDGYCKAYGCGGAGAID